MDELFFLDGKVFTESYSNGRYAVLKDTQTQVYYVYEAFSWGYGYCANTHTLLDQAISIANYENDWS